MTRREDDFYPTLDMTAIGRLMQHWDVPKTNMIFECCAGELHLVNQMKDLGYKARHGDVTSSHSYFDATSEYMWQQWKLDECGLNFTITNPPFNQATEIIPLAYEHSRDGIAMLLRLSYLEPCKNRAQWLVEHPITKLIPIPRISFTGDGRHDKVSTAWFVWDKRPHPDKQKQEIIISP